MKRAICILFTILFILVLLASCANNTNNITIGGQGNNLVESPTNSAQPESAQASNSTSVLLYIVIIVIGLPLFLIAIFVVYKIIQAYRNRYYH